MNEASLQLEAVMRCSQCGGAPYKLFRRSTAEHPEIFTHIVWPTDAGIPPPLEPTLRCPLDQTLLTRTAA